MPEDWLCREVRPVSKFTCLGKSVSASGGHEVSVTARTRFWCVMLVECGQLMCGN